MVAELTNRIPINHKGEVIYATIDAEDYPIISRHTWYIRSTTYPNNPYAVTNAPKMRGNLALLPMHYFIMGTGTTVDHVNGNTLDNRKENLRAATAQQNGWNKPKNIYLRSGKTPTSQYKGVRRVDSKTKGTRWLAFFKHVEPGKHKSTGKMIYVGYFNSEIEAAKAYNAKVRELRGEWAWINPIPDEPNQYEYSGTK